MNTPVDKPVDKHTDTTHFGYTDVPTEEKVRLVGGVFDSVASRYDIMNDLMSFGVHRLWKRATIDAASVRPGHRVLDLAGGTGDLASRFVERVGSKGQVVLSDIKSAPATRTSQAALSLCTRVSNSDVSLPSPVSLLGAAAMEQGIDTLLRLDPITRQRLALIDARVIRVVVSSPPLEVTAVVTEGRVSVATEHDDEVDLTVTGSLAALRSLAGSQDALHTGDVTITGDLRVASHLREILSGIDPDWQELVSPVIGDTATHKLERAARDALQWVSVTVWKSCF